MKAKFFNKTLKVYRIDYSVDSIPVDYTGRLRYNLFWVIFDSFDILGTCNRNIPLHRVILRVKIEVPFG